MGSTSAFTSILCGLLLASAATAQAPRLLYRFDGGTAGDLLGTPARGAGDVDGDGVPDLLVGAQLEDANGVDSGALRVYSGRTGTLLRLLAGELPGDTFGHTAAGGFDADGDGFADVVVGAKFTDVNGVDSGSAYVYSGRTWALLHTLRGDAAGDWFGRSVAAAGDVDADGFDDFVVGAPQDDDRGVDSGSATVYSGRSGHVLHRFLGHAEYDWFGYCVAGVGDVDADGFDDVAVSALHDARNGANAGAVEVFSGRDGGLLMLLFGDSAGDLFGYSIGRAGDVDADGHADLIVGALNDSNNGANSGSARVVSGRTGQALWTFDGDSAGDELGFSVDGVGDVDGDGFDDLIAGAWLSDLGGVPAGAAPVYSGRHGSVLVAFIGTNPNDLLGYHVGSVGDLDGDGFTEVAIGAIRTDVHGTDSGSAYVYALGFSGSPARVSIHGAGCVGSNGHLPRIDVSARPFVGRFFSIDLRGALPATGVVLNLGTATSLELGSIGMTGCRLLATADDFVVPFVTDAYGLCATGALLVPNDPNLVGLGLTAQWVCFDPAANRIGVTLSNAATLTFGS